MTSIPKKVKLIIFILIVVAIAVIGIKSNRSSVDSNPPRNTNAGNQGLPKSKNVTFADEQPVPKYDLYGEIETFLTQQSEYLSN